MHQATIRIERAPESVGDNASDKAAACGDVARAPDVKRSHLGLEHEYEFGVIKKILKIIFAPFAEADGVVVGNEFAAGDLRSIIAVREGLKQKHLFAGVAQSRKIVAIIGRQSDPPSLRVGDQILWQAFDEIRQQWFHIAATLENEFELRSVSANLIRQLGHDLALGEPIETSANVQIAWAWF